jgi:vitamin B12 transporter
MQNQLKRQFCCLMLAVIIPPNIESALAIETLPEITVTAPRKPLAEQINNPQQLDEEDIAIAHERTITDVLQGLPGITATKVGGFGQPSGLYIRGVGGQGVVTLDDIPLLQSLPGLLNLDALPAEAIQSAEIVRGPDSAYRPFQSLGGGIRLTTQDRRDTGGRLSVEGGSFGLLRETLQTGINGRLGRVTATLSRTDVFDGMHVADSKTNPERDPTHFTQGILRFSSDLSKRVNWQGSMLYRKSGISIDTYSNIKKDLVVGVDDLNGHASEESWLAQNSLNAQLSKSWNTQLQLGYTQMASQSNLTLLQNKVFTRLYLANWRNRHTLLENNDKNICWQLNWGVQGRHEQAESTTSPFPQQRTMVAPFLQTEGQVNHFSGEVGVRVEHYNQYGDHPLFRAAAAWRIAPDLTLRSSGGTGYRLPSYTELLFLFFASKDLKPERSASGDLSLEWYPIKGAKLTLNGFYNRYDNLITIAHETHRGPVSINVSDAYVAGMEFDAQYAWTDKLDTGISYTFAESRDLHSGKALPFRPEHTARFWGQQKLAFVPLTLWAEAIVRSSTWNDFENTLPVGSALQINAAIRYALSNHVELYLRGENLTNNRTTQLFSANAPGVAVYGGFKLDF